MVKTDTFQVKPIVATSSLRALAYDALKEAITNMNIYNQREEVRLDERKLSLNLGVSRTPVREALTVLEQEGFVRFEARRGVFVIKKSKKEIVSMIQAWSALESMAARLACERATTNNFTACVSTFQNSMKDARRIISTSIRKPTFASTRRSFRSASAT